MRTILAGLAIVLLPSLASAQCVCGCIRGRSVPVCQSQALVQPLCQEICTDKIEQSLGAFAGGEGAGMGPTGGIDALGATGSGAATSGVDPAVLKALLGR